MNDPYKKAWESIGKALSTQSKMVLWIAERTLSAKDFKEFIDEFAKKPEGNHDELIDFLSKEEQEATMHKHICPHCKHEWWSGKEYEFTCPECDGDMF